MDDRGTLSHAADREAARSNPLRLPASQLIRGVRRMSKCAELIKAELSNADVELFSTCLQQFEQCVKQRQELEAGIQGLDVMGYLRKGMEFQTATKVLYMSTEGGSDKQRLLELRTTQELLKFQETPEYHQYVINETKFVAWAKARLTFLEAKERSQPVPKLVPREEVMYSKDDSNHQRVLVEEGPANLSPSDFRRGDVTQDMTIIVRQPFIAVPSRNPALQGSEFFPIVPNPPPVSRGYSVNLPQVPWSPAPASGFADASSLYSLNDLPPPPARNLRAPQMRQTRSHEPHANIHPSETTQYPGNQPTSVATSFVPKQPHTSGQQPRPAQTVPSTSEFKRTRSLDPSLQYASVHSEGKDRSPRDAPPDRLPPRQDHRDNRDSEKEYSEPSRRRHDSQSTGHRDDRDRGRDNDSGRHHSRSHDRARSTSRREHSDSDRYRDYEYSRDKYRSSPHHGYERSRDRREHSGSDRHREYDSTERYPRHGTDRREYREKSRHDSEDKRLHHEMLADPNATAQGQTYAVRHRDMTAQMTELNLSKNPPPNDSGKDKGRDRRENQKPHANVPVDFPRVSGMPEPVAMPVPPQASRTRRDTGQSSSRIPPGSVPPNRQSSSRASQPSDHAQQQPSSYASPEAMQERNLSRNPPPRDPGKVKGKDKREDQKPHANVPVDFPRVLGMPEPGIMPVPPPQTSRPRRDTHGQSSSHIPPGPGPSNWQAPPRPGPPHHPQQHPTSYVSPEVLYEEPRGRSRDKDHKRSKRH